MIERVLSVLSRVIFIGEDTVALGTVTLVETSVALVG